MERKYHLPVLEEEGQYQNPLAYPWDTEVPTNPDPYVIRYGGKYYCYSSGREGVNVSVSENLREWRYLGKTAKEEDKHEYWAPCVIYDNGTFYMYCSNTAADTDDCHQEFLQLYTSQSPEGPFTYQKTFFERFSIDAHVVKDTDGEVYLFYSVNDYMGTDEYHSGTVILVDRLIHYTELAGEVRPVVLPSMEEEVYEKNRFGDGRDWHTIEGAFFFRHHRRAYMMYAANAYVRENYFLGYSSADAEARIADMDWRKYPDEGTFVPFIRRNEKVEGTGHNSVIKAPDLVNDWIVYHGRNQEEELIQGIEQRKMRIDPLLYNGDRLITNAPSYEVQDGPGSASFETYNVEKNSDFREYMAGGLRKQVLEKTFTNYVLEADIRCELTHMGGRYGLLLWYQDEENYMELLLHSGKGQIEITQTRQNIVSTLGRCGLDIGYNHDAIHNIQVIRNYAQFKITLDTVPKLMIETELPPGKVGTVSRYTDAEAIHFAVTAHTELYGETLRFMPRMFKSSGIIKCSEEKLGTPSGREVTLVEAERTLSCMKEIEVGLRSREAKVSLSLTDEKSKDGIRIYIDTQKIYVEEVSKGEKTLLGEMEHDEHLLTVYIKNRNGCIAAYVNGIPFLSQETGYMECRLHITLKNADIYGYSLTNYTL